MIGSEPIEGEGMTLGLRECWQRYPGVSERSIDQRPKNDQSPVPEFQSALAGKWPNWKSGWGRWSFLGHWRSNSLGFRGVQNPRPRLASRPGPLGAGKHPPVHLIRRRGGRHGRVMTRNDPTRRGENDESRAAAPPACVGLAPAFARSDPLVLHLLQATQPPAKSGRKS
jgi:hypothetical protein